MTLLDSDFTHKKMTFLDSDFTKNMTLPDSDFIETELLDIDYVYTPFEQNEHNHP